VDLKAGNKRFYVDTPPNAQIKLETGDRILVIASEEALQNHEGLFESSEYWRVETLRRMTTRRRNGISPEGLSVR